MEGLTRQEVKFENKAEEKPEEKEEKHGIVNDLLTKVGLRSKGEIISAPVESVDDYKNEVKSLSDQLAEKQMELDNLAKTIEAQKAEFVKERETALTEIENLKTDLVAAKEAIDNKVKEGVHNHLASLGYNPAELPTPATPANSQPVQPDDIAEFLKQLGI